MEVMSDCNYTFCVVTAVLYSFKRVSGYNLFDIIRIKNTAIGVLELSVCTTQASSGGAPLVSVTRMAARMRQKSTGKPPSKGPKCTCRNRIGI